MPRNCRYSMAEGEGVVWTWGRGLPIRKGSGRGPGGDTGDMAFCGPGSSCASPVEAPKSTIIRRTAVTRKTRNLLLEFAPVRKVVISFVLVSVAICSAETIRLKNGRTIVAD